ncbi:MAG TPA: hypothetical protein VNZ22_13440 [Bacillota bacterium]|nr:hypothetical protein [Bacillota bacterium]
MGQPVKVSDSLVRDARLMGEAPQRSIAGQIEFWARLGRAMETLLRGDQVLALCEAEKAQSLSACLQSVDSAEGHQRLKAHLNSLPYPTRANQRVGRSGMRPYRDRFLAPGRSRSGSIDTT